MIKRFAKLMNDATGATAIEYGLIAALIAVAAIGSVTRCGTGSATGTFGGASGIAGFDAIGAAGEIIGWFSGGAALSAISALNSFGRSESAVTWARRDFPEAGTALELDNRSAKKMPPPKPPARAITTVPTPAQ